MCAKIVKASELSKAVVVEALKSVASEWRAGADQSLVEVEASVALLLYDIMEALGFTDQEEEAVLEQDLAEVKLIAGDAITVSA